MIAAILAAALASTPVPVVCTGTACATPAPIGREEIPTRMLDVKAFVEVAAPPCGTTEAVHAGVCLGWVVRKCPQAGRGMPVGPDGHIMTLNQRPIGCP